jgi:hypothetical protein
MKCLIYGVMPLPYLFNGARHSANSELTNQIDFSFGYSPSLFRNGGIAKSNFYKKPIALLYQ